MNKKHIKIAGIIKDAYNVLEDTITLSCEVIGKSTEERKQLYKEVKKLMTI